MVATGLWHRPASLVVAVCWGLFCLVWLVGAVYNHRRGPAVRERTTFTPVWVLAGLGVWAVGRLVPAHVWRSLTVESRWLTVLGIAVLLVSTAFTLWARAVLGRMWTSAAAAKEDHVLRTEGPYGITRHPIYTGVLGMLLGTALTSGLGRWAALPVVGVPVFGMKIRAEERLLSRVFPEAYAQYRRQVPQLVPGLRRPGRRRGAPR